MVSPVTLVLPAVVFLISFLVIKKMGTLRFERFDVRTNSSYELVQGDESNQYFVADVFLANPHNVGDLASWMQNEVGKLKFGSETPDGISVY